MSRVTISKEEYRELKRRSEAYKKLTGRLFETIIKDSVAEVIHDFKKTGLYTPEFLTDLEGGLRKSSYSLK